MYPSYTTGHTRPLQHPPPLLLLDAKHHQVAIGCQLFSCLHPRGPAMQSQLFYYSIDYWCAAKGVLVPCVPNNTRMHEHRVCFVHLQLAQKTTHVQIRQAVSPNLTAPGFSVITYCALSSTQELCKGSGTPNCCLTHKWNNSQSLFPDPHRE